MKNKVQSEAYSKIIHDVKSPLAGVKAELSLLLKYSSKISEKDAKKILKKVDSKIDKLTRDLDYFFLSERLEKNFLKPLYEFIKLDEFTQEISQSAERKLKKKIIFDGVIKKTIMIDRKLLTEIFYLISLSVPDKTLEIRLSQKGKNIELLIGKKVATDSLYYSLIEKIVDEIGGSLKNSKALKIKIPQKPKG